jgi:hypothetical protein
MSLAVTDHPTALGCKNARFGNRDEGLTVTPAPATGPDAAFDAYTAALDAEGAPLLGHLVLYSVFDGRVKREDLERWFLELGLDSALLPPPIRPVDAFEKVTGRNGIRVTYPLDGQRPITASGKRARRPLNGTAREATLMVRHVRRDRDHIIRHLVREVRDELQTTLTYDAHVAECVFTRDTSDTSAPGAGTLHVTADHSAIAELPESERATVYTVLDELRDTYAHRCAFLTADRLRTLIRSYVENLGATRVRPSGGVYFVHRQHAQALAALRELVARMGEGSHLVRIPIPDQDEMREMILAAFTTKAKDDLDRLARDIAAAQKDGAPDHEVQVLYRRFQQMKTATAEHSELLSTSLDDTKAALELVNLQLVGLLATAGGSSDE